MVNQSLPWRRWREAAVLGAVLCVAATVAVVFVHEHERQSVELLFKWGPPSIRPGGEKKAEPLRSWSPPQMLPAVMRTEEASMPIVEVDEKNEQHQQHAKQHKQAPFAVNVDVDQQDSKNVKFAPVNVNIILPDQDAARSEVEEAEAAAMHKPQHKLWQQRVVAEPVRMVEEPQFHAAPMQFVPERMVAAPPMLKQKKPSAMPAVTMALANTQPHTPSEDAVVHMVEGMVSASALKTMEETLQSELLDAKDSAISGTGVDRVHKLERESTAVKQRLDALPSLLSPRIQKTGREADSAANAIKEIQSELSTFQSRMAIARKEEPPRQVRELEAKVELQRAAADALADLQGKPAVHFAHLDAPEPSSYTGPSVHALKQAKAALKRRLAREEGVFAAATKEHSALVADEEAAQAAAGEIGDEELFGEEASVRSAGRPAVLAQAHAAGAQARLAELSKASQTMLAEEDKQPARAQTQQKVQQFCQWGSEMVPCSPGAGGAWKEAQPQDAGIWPVLPDAKKGPEVRGEVKAGERSQSYMADAFKYGAGGVFGVRKPQGGPRVAPGKQLARAHSNAKRQGAAASSSRTGAGAAAAAAAAAAAKRAGWSEEAAAVTMQQQQLLAKGLAHTQQQAAATQQQTAAPAEAAKGEKKPEKKEKKEKSLHEIVQAGLQADRLRHNTVAPEWTDRLLGKAKKAYSYMSKSLDYSHLPSGDKLADNWGTSVHGVVDPAWIDEMIAPPADKSKRAKAPQAGNGMDNQASSLARIRPLPPPTPLAQPHQQIGKGEEERASELEREREAQMAALNRIAAVN